MPTISPSSPHPSSLTLEAFCAAERPDLAELYCLGQADSYRRHPGCVAALWTVHIAEAFVVLARARDGAAAGGMRVHLRRSGSPLPIERALAAICPIEQAVARAPGPLVELCGTWVAPSYRRTDLAANLTAATLAVARALGAAQIVGCAHQHVLDLYRRFGAVVDDTLGVHPYPDPRYQTCVFWADPFACPEAQAVEAWAEALRAGPSVEFAPLPAAAA
jgi:GNAT superfamily N-acetyltransferase